MNISGALVVAAPARLEEVERALANIEGVDVHHAHAPTGRMIITIEAETVEDEIATLRRAQALDGVVLAEMVHHHFEENLGAMPDSDAIPLCLRDDDEPTSPLDSSSTTRRRAQ